MAHPITGRSVPVPADQLLVSKTDARGVITYANRAFQAITGYPRGALIGRPHAVVRHPWMPRCIFARLWRDLGRGVPWYGYVVNRTRTGDHYWVLAHVTPDVDPRTGAIRGYHSARRGASPRAIDTMGALYERLRDVEAGVPRADQCAAGGDCLDSILAARGTTLEAWVFELDHAEAAA